MPYAPVPPAQALCARPAAPWRGRHLRFGLLRGTPVSLSEHAALVRLADRPLGPHISGLRLRTLGAVEGAGALRAWLDIELLDFDPDLVELTAVAALAGAMAGTLPGGTLACRDPLALFSLVDGRVRVGPGDPLPALDVGPPPPGCALNMRAASPGRGAPPPVSSASPRAELVDLLQRWDAVEDPHLCDPGPPPGPRHAAGLREALFSGLYPGAACRLMTTLPVELLDRDALAEGALALLGDGDATERRDAAALLRHLGAPMTAPASARRPHAADWDALASVGSHLLDRLDRASTSERAILPAAVDEEPDDDLDPGDPEGASAVDPVDGVLDELADDPLVHGLVALAEQADFPTRVTARLSGGDDDAAGVVIMLLLGAWPAARIPGWATTLMDLVTSDRPTALRALALRTLGRQGGPDAEALLLDAADWSEPALAGAALRGLAWHPSDRVLAVLRAAVDRPAVAVDGLLALADAADPGAFDVVARSLAEGREEVAAAAAHTLAIIGGRRALRPLRDLLTAAGNAPTAVAAARAIARVMPADQVVELLGGRGAEPQAAALRGAGEADRVDLLGWILSCTRDARPELRHAAADALGMLGLGAATPRLLELLLDEDHPVALAALDALRLAGDSRCVRLLRLLAAHPGLPGRMARQVLLRGRHLRRPPPDDRVLVRLRSSRPLAPAELEVVTRTLRGAGLSTTLGDRLVTAQGRVDPADTAALSTIAHGLQAIDALHPGLEWSVRDASGVIRQGPAGWFLSRRRGRIARAAGGWSLDAATVTRVPLTAEVVERPDDPGMADALPVGTGTPDSPADRDAFDAAGSPAPISDEEVDDDRTEQTISAFLEEVTGLDTPRPASHAPRPPPPAGRDGLGRPGHLEEQEELLFELDP